MLSKYHQNAIITGYIDSYCLVCESHLRSEDDISVHIAKPIHAKNLDATSLLEKYKEDCVRKVKKGYFCQFCNILLSTAAKVGLHVVEVKHINNRGTQLLKRNGNNITFHEILIDENAWHGLIDETCAICNTEFDNENLHKTETAHILNLVQNKVEFGAEKSIYRKIDEESFQCLTCNMVLGINTIISHFNEAEHKKLYQECVQAFTAVNQNSKSGKDAQVHQDPKPKTPTTNVQENTSDVQKTQFEFSPKKVDDKQEPTKKVPVANVKKQEPEVTFPFKFNFSSTKPDSKQEPAKIEVPNASVKKQDTSTGKQSAPVDVANKMQVSAEAKKSEKTKLEMVTHDLDEQICKALGAKDYITHDENGKKWCLLCDWTMDSVVIYDHVNGRHHQAMLRLHTERLQKQKKSQDSAVNKNVKEQKAEKVESPLERENKSKILDSVSHYQQNDININFVCNTAMCKKCMKYLDFNSKIIEAHIEEHKQAPPKKEVMAPPATAVHQKPADAKTAQTDKKAQLPKRGDDERADSRASSVASTKENDEEVEKYAKANDLSYNRTDSKVYCRVCDSRVPSSLKNMKEHIAGGHHKNKAAKWRMQNPKIPATIKKPMKDFIKNIVAVENGFIKDVVINERYCINVFSFMMITRMDRMRCEACEVNLSCGQLDDHRNCLGHQKAMSETPIIVSMESEFIREVRPEVFHCGYCNAVSSGEHLQDHLGSTAHREAKTVGAWKLQQSLPELMNNQKRRQELEMFMMCQLLACGNAFD